MFETLTSYLLYKRTRSRDMSSDQYICQVRQSWEPNLRYILYTTQVYTSNLNNNNNFLFSDVVFSSNQITIETIFPC